MTPQSSTCSMKDSGIEWVGQVPSHWSVRPFYSFAAEVDHPNTGLKERNLLSLSYGRLVRKDMDRLEGLTPASFEGYNIIEANDIVFRLTDLQNDKNSLRSARSPERGIITSAYVTVRPAASPRFFEYLMRAYDTTKVFYGIGGGIRQSMKFDDLKRLPVVVPPVTEMDAIASHLDRATTRIDALVAKKTRFIELLREKRQALITHAVTKGLDRGVAMKDSGVEWLGEVPADWKVIALKRLGRLKGGNGFPPGLQGRPDNDLPFYKVSDLGKSADGQHLGTTDNTISPDDAADLGATVFPAAALAWAKIGAALSLNRRRIITTPSCLDNNMTGFIPDADVVSTRFSFYLMSSIDFTVHAKPGAVPSFSEGDQGELLVSLPPAVTQQLIVAHLDRTTARIDTLIAKTERSIELLREHRTALITAAVTGKIDLRPAA